jgi:hypothetical protein
MYPFAIGVVGLTFLQASIAGPRQDYSDCLKKAGVQAEAQQVAPDQFSAFAKQQCAASGASFKAALMAFDIKNGIKRSQAASDADLQLEDYLSVSQEKYQARVKFSAKPSPPAPVQAAAPAPKQD